MRALAVALLCIVPFLNSCAVVVGAAAGGAIGYYIGKEGIPGKKDKKENKDSRVRIEIEE